MITQTTLGTIHPLIGARDAMNYVAKPNGYISDLKDTVLEQKHTEAVTGKIKEDLQLGRDFAEDVVRKADWYDEPSFSIIDEWA